MQMYDLKNCKIIVWIGANDLAFSSDVITSRID